MKTTIPNFFIRERVHSAEKASPDFQNSLFWTQKSLKTLKEQSYKPNSDTTNEGH